MSEPIYDFVMKNLEATRGNWQVIADATGIPKSTIVKIGCRIVSDPGVSRVERLAEYFRANPAIVEPKPRAKTKLS